MYFRSVVCEGRHHCLLVRRHK